MNDDTPVEFTLEDAYEHLRDLQEEMTQEMENLMHRSSNNETTTIARGVDKGAIADRYQKLLRGLAISFSLEEPKDLPVPNTIDLHETMIRDVENVVDEMRRLILEISKNMNLSKKNIAYLESNKQGLEKMREACLGAVESVGNETNTEEIAVSKNLFSEAKKDLYSVVDQMFPNEDGLKDVLAALTLASSKGGDEVYIAVGPEVFEFAKILVEADIAAYHRNDKTKIRMTEML